MWHLSTGQMVISKQKHYNDDDVQKYGRGLFRIQNPPKWGTKTAFRMPRAVRAQIKGSQALNPRK